ncbi:MAG: hypothetical protein ACXABY_02520 [Candidatus Thorarchaeota archaeon]|jgi:hypothetical protein
MSRYFEQVREQGNLVTEYGDVGRELVKAYDRIDDLEKLLEDIVNAADNDEGYSREELVTLIMPILNKGLDDGN